MNSNTLTVLENTTEFVTRKEHEAAILQICREIADDRKRITQQENFSTALYDLLFVEMRASRVKIESKLKKLLPSYYFHSTTTSSGSTGVQWKEFQNTTTEVTD